MSGKNGKVNKEIIVRYMIFLIGLFVASMGVAFAAKAGLGTSPVSSVPYALSLVSSLLTFGGWLNLLSMIQIAVQVILLRDKCKPFDIVIQVLLAFAYGYMTDFSCSLIAGINLPTYLMQFIFMLLGSFILALGIFIQLKGGVAMLPGEAMNRAISQVSGRRYENIKIFFDVVYIIVGAAIMLIFKGKLEGVREGSIIAAFLVGTTIKVYNRLFNRLFPHKGGETESESADNEEQSDRS